ncbi:hypothetical protein L1987_10260 [Smallanthus sonchifolius]|uniref:Uncharacterized protein n=1 Tax=Smallanthus sonchifolius TaxID=185202 RepID=A0ACB9JRN1_9ASTR|nr:hypothetical protein L1987_10260 [Smallanthus sonchifolius]
MGKGDKTWFWHDVWLTNFPLKDLFPNVYNTATDKQGLVTKHYKWSGQNRVWDWNWITLPQEQGTKNETEELPNLIRNYNLKDYEDSWVWKVDGEVEFTVKAVRDELHNAANSHKLRAKILDLRLETWVLYGLKALLV